MTAQTELAWSWLVHELLVVHLGQERAQGRLQDPRRCLHPTVSCMLPMLQCPNQLRFNERGASLGSQCARALCAASFSGRLVENAEMTVHILPLYFPSVGRDLTQVRISALQKWEGTAAPHPTRDWASLASTGMKLKLMKNPKLVIHAFLVLDDFPVSFYQVTYLETMDFLINVDS